MQKYKIVFDMLEDKKKQAEIVKETGFTIDIVKKVSQLRKIYSKIEEQIKDKLLLDRLYSLKFKAIELKKIADTKELLEEFLESAYADMKTSEVKSKVNELTTRKTRMLEAKEQYLIKKQELEKDEERILDLINDSEQRRNYLEELYPFLNGRTKEVKDYLMTLIGVKDEKYVLKHRISMDINKNKLPINYDMSRGLWYITDIDKFVKIIEHRINKKQSVLWGESSYFKTATYYYYSYNKWSKSDGEYKRPKGLETLGLEVLEKDIKKYKKELGKVRKDLKEIRENIPNNYKEDTLFADSISHSEIAEHRLVQDIFLKEYFKEGYVAAAEITIGNKRFDTTLYKPKEVVIGEVKASRSDFIGDKKYLTYMDYCNELYMVLSSKINIKDEEIQRLKDEGVGLYFVDTETREVKKVHSSLQREIKEEVQQEVFNKMIKTLRDKVSKRY
ncbi:MAG: hypothetical protein J6D47_21220 [Peptostreptococcaceae bacterium]|nr:hypothetical protein [Peptostreptococcaceae bacterium]